MLFFKRFCLFLCLISHGALAVIGIDVAPFAFDAQRKGVRVVQFDAEAMNFVCVDYFQAPTASTSRAPGNAAVPFPLLTITYEGVVTVPDAFEWDKYFVRSMTGVQTIRTETLAPDALIEKMKARSRSPKRNPKDCKGDCKVILHRNNVPEAKTFANIVEGSTKKNSDERGVLGEIATDLLMIAHGYDKWQAQNGSNNGFDGVYVGRSADKPLFLTETKCRAESKGADKYFAESLSLEPIKRKMEQMKQAGTRDMITPYLAGSGLIYRFAQRVLPCGKSEFYSEPLDPSAYRVASVSKESPAKIKEEAIVACSKNFESPLAFLEVALSALDISDADLEILVRTHQKGKKKLEFKAEDTASSSKQ